MTAPLPPLLLKGDCLVELARIPDASVDAVVTDPPYGLGFMGKGWDIHTPLDFERFCAAWAAECLRILKPGGHMLAFGGSRTWHRLAAGIEDAGFEIRDSIAWLYGSGFPKSMDVSKAIDKSLGATRTEYAGVRPGHESFVGRDNLKSLRDSGALSGEGGYSRPWMHDAEKVEAQHHVLAPATDAAREWQGWGTALKPAFEPIVVARKPLIGTVAANVLAHGTGALNIDATRIATDEDTRRPFGTPSDHVAQLKTLPPGELNTGSDKGRWPANVVLDEAQAAALDAQSGYMKDGVSVNRNRNADEIANKVYGARRKVTTDAGYGSGGGASRFFYVAKAPKSERPVVDSTSHPTVKPLALMRWLIRLVTPPGGCVVDPFAGSGTTLEAAYLEGMESIGVEMTPDYWPLIAARIERVTS